MTGDIVTAVVWGIFVAGAGAFLTELTPWYRALRKPTWQPPDWLFGPAWTLILSLASLSFYLGLRDATDFYRRLVIIGLFILNGVLNILWSPLFFRWRRPDWALAEVPLLWLSVLVPALLLMRTSETAGLLLMPYLGWVAFAAVLNLTIVRMNQPFVG